MAPETHAITQLLLAWGGGDEVALTKLVPLVYTELLHMAQAQMRRERSGHVLQPTALVHEAYLRLIDSSHVHWRNRAHFFAVSARVMRRILVDFARSRQSWKRRASFEVAIDEAFGIPSERTDLLALDDALSVLGSIDPRKEKVVELRFFGGLSADETAEVLQVSPQTVLRDWRLAKVWLMRELDVKRSDTRLMATN